MVRRAVSHAQLLDASADLKATTPPPFKLIPAKGDSQDLYGRIPAEASRQMATNASNTCGDPFYARVRHHVRAEYGLSEEEA